MIHFIANSIISPPDPKIFHPGHTLESPEDKKFAQGTPIKRRDVGQGGNGAEHHFYPDKTEAIAKSDPISVAVEPLARNIRVGNEPIPPTSIRRYPNDAGEMTNYSVQQRVPGDTRFNLLRNQEKELLAHPQYHSAVLGAWLRGDEDMHDNNIMWDSETKTPYSIDNGLSFSYVKPDNTPTNQLDANGNVINSHKELWPQKTLAELAHHNYSIPEDFRNEIMSENGLQNRLNIMQKYFNHKTFKDAIRENKETAFPSWGADYKAPIREVPEMIRKHYANHWNTLRNHFSDPNVKTFRDLYSRLYPDSKASDTVKYLNEIRGRH